MDWVTFCLQTVHPGSAENQVQGNQPCSAGHILLHALSKYTMQLVCSTKLSCFMKPKLCPVVLLLHWDGQHSRLNFDDAAVPWSKAGEPTAAAGCTSESQIRMCIIQKKPKKPQKPPKKQKKTQQQQQQPSTAVLKKNLTTSTLKTPRAPKTLSTSKLERR